MATLIAVVGLLVLLLLGWWLVARNRRRPAQPLSPATDGGSTVLDTTLLARIVINTLEQAVVVVDRDELVVLANHAARQTGVLVNDNLACAELADLVRGVLMNEAPVQASVHLPDGRLGSEPVALAARAVALASGPDGRVSAVGLVLADQTEQRRLEAVRRDFVANVSHELKTPVGALRLLAETIQDAADDPAAVHRFAGRIQHEASRLGRLVDELLELSRVQGADRRPGVAEVDVGDILSEAVQRTELASEQAGIELTVVCAPSLRVCGNGGQLATAVANLVDNAIAYSESGSRVAVTAQATHDPDGHPVVDIAVTDQGIGIAAAERERIFERFYRVDPARSRATGGTGLGLAIVKNIVQNHSGSVRVWSALEAGSTFTIRLPRSNPDQPALEAPDRADSGQRTGTGVIASEPGPASTWAAR